jgi:galactose mutarotase-like enzyme
MINEIIFKNCYCIKLENEVLRVIIIPSMGGKVASIYRKDKDFELLYQNKESVYRRPKIYDDFSEYDVSGFDDAFPCIDESKVNIAGREVIYPDHGEIWSAQFDYKIKGEKIELIYVSKTFNYKYKKIFSILGDNITVKYEILNIGVEKFPCIWSMHCLIKCEEDMELILPKGTKEVINVLKSDLLGEVGDIYTYPKTINNHGKSMKLNKVRTPDVNDMEKFYIKRDVTQGYCGAYYPSKDVKYEVHYKKEILPYLGVWINEGGYKSGYNCALEPTNGYYDSIDIAKKEKGLYVLKPKECLKFKLLIHLK